MLIRWISKVERCKENIFNDTVYMYAWPESIHTDTLQSDLPSTSIKGDTK